MEINTIQTGLGFKTGKINKLKKKKVMLEENRLSTQSTVAEIVKGNEGGADTKDINNCNLPCFFFLSLKLYPVFSGSVLNE